MSNKQTALVAVLTIAIAATSGIFANASAASHHKKLSYAAEEHEIAVFLGPTERRIKALQYFIEKFCPGTQRKSAF